MTTFDPVEVRKAVAEFTPRRPQKFQDLPPAKDAITELRQKRASYRSAVTNARFASLHGLPVVRIPLNHARSSPQDRALVTSGLPPWARSAAGFRLRLGGGTFRCGCDALNAPLRPPLHFPRSPTTDRSQKIRILGKMLNSPMIGCRITRHPSIYRNSAMNPAFDYVAASAASRMLRFALLNARASVAPLTRPPPPGLLPLGFHRGKPVCSNDHLVGIPQLYALISPQIWRNEFIAKRAVGHH